MSSEKPTPAPPSSGAAIVSTLAALLAETASAIGEATQAIGAHAAAALRGLGALRVDLAIALALGLGAAILALWLNGRLDFQCLATNGDVWFGADTPRVIAANVNRWDPGHFRTSVHPLWALIVSTPFNILYSLGVDEKLESSILVAIGALLLIGLFFGAARVSGLRRSEAVACTLLAASSSAAIFWLAIPETYALSAASMMVALVWLGAPRGAHDQWSAPAQSVLALAMTVTNWTAGLIAAVLGLGVRRGLAVSATAFLIVSALIVVQQNIYPSAGKFLALQHEAQYISDGAQMLSSQRALNLLTQPLLAPAPQIAHAPPALPTYIGFEAGDLPNLALAALAGWAALIAMGLAAAARGRIPAKIVIAVVALLVTHLCLHMIYGLPQETFLYALHYAPFMVLIAGWAFRAQRSIAWGLVALTLSATALNNIEQHERAAALLPLAAAEAAPSATP